MNQKARSASDAFTLSLGGTTAISSFVAAPAVDCDRINKASDARIKEIREGRDRTTRLGPNGRWQPVLCVIA